MASKRRRKGSRRELDPTGIDVVDALAAVPGCTIEDYIAAVSAYVRQSHRLAPGAKKAGQIRLSNALGRALVGDLNAKLPQLKNVAVGEHKVAGALRTTNADVSEMHPLDGLRLAIELKPVNLAVGRAIWNRFGDLRTFAVNLHLKFPFSVIGGVLVIPTYEEMGTREAATAEAVEVAAETADSLVAVEEVTPLSVPTGEAHFKSTRHLIDRAVRRLMRAGGRKNEADGAHLLEAIAVVAYDPTTGKMDEDVPPLDSGLRWSNFIAALAAAYEARFED